MFSILTGLAVVIGTSWPGRQMAKAALVVLGVAVHRETSLNETYRETVALGFDLEEEFDMLQKGQLPKSLRRFTFSDGALPKKLNFLYSIDFCLTYDEVFTLKSGIETVKSGGIESVDYDRLIAVSKARIKAGLL